MDFKEKLIENQLNTIDSLTKEISLLREESARREQEYSKQIAELNQQIVNLNETIRNIAGSRFGSSSEKSKGRQIEGQLDLGFFNESEYYSDESTPEPTIQELCKERLKPNAPKKSRGTREELFADVPIIEELHVLLDRDKVCDLCLSDMVSIGKEYVREEIRIIPAQIERIHIYRESYVCTECKEDDVIEVKKAKVPAPLFKHSLASPSIVSHIMYQKYVNALPLNRQEKDFSRLGVTLKRSVQANWVNNASIRYFTPIYERLHKELLSRDLAMSDETPCQVHNEEGRKDTTDSYMCYALSFQERPKHTGMAYFSHFPSKLIT